MAKFIEVTIKDGQSTKKIIYNTNAIDRVFPSEGGATLYLTNSSSIYIKETYTEVKKALGR